MYSRRNWTHRVGYHQGGIPEIPVLYLMLKDTTNPPFRRRHFPISSSVAARYRCHVLDIGVAGSRDLLVAATTEQVGCWCADDTEPL
jgi:hypothetical protein